MSQGRIIDLRFFHAFSTDAGEKSIVGNCMVSLYIAMTRGESEPLLELFSWARLL